MSSYENFCPNCRNNLTGNEIPEEYRHLYEGTTHYDTKIGVSIQGVYDGVLFWMCPSCKWAWHRFIDEAMQAKAQPFIDQYNANADKRKPEDFTNADKPEDLSQPEKPEDSPRTHKPEDFSHTQPPAGS